MLADVVDAGLDLDGEGDPEGGAVAGGAADADGATEEGGQFAADGEAEAGAAVLAGDGAVDLAELFEDELVLVGGDAGAVVGDLDADVVDVGVGAVGAGGEGDLGVGGAELDGVAEEVVEDLLELGGVGVEDGDGGVDGGVDEQAAGGGGGLEDAG